MIFHASFCTKREVRTIATVDSLEIKISASAEAATKAIKTLSNSLGTLEKKLNLKTDSIEKLGNVNGGNIKKLGDGLAQFANAAKSIQNIDKSAFGKLANGLSKIASIKPEKLEALGKIDGTSFKQLGEGVKELSSGLKNLEGVKVEDFNTIAKAIGKLGGANSSGLGNTGNAIKNIGEEARKASDSMKPIEEQAKKIVKTFEQIAAPIKDLGKGFRIEGDTSQIEKAIQKYTNALEKAKLKEQELSMKGLTNTNQYEKAVTDVVKYENIIKSLKNQLDSLNNTRATAEIKINGIESAKKPLNEYENQLANFKNDIKSFEQVYGNLANIPKGMLGTPIQNLTASLAELITAYPQATDVISQFENELKRLQSISSGLTREAIRPTVNTSSLDDINKKIEELQKKFEKNDINFKFSGNFQEIENELQKVKDKYDQLKQKEQEMISARKVDTSQFERLQSNLSGVGNRLGILQDLRDRTEEFNQSLQRIRVPEIREDNLGKLQKSLQRAEEEIDRLKTKLQNDITTGKITESVDDSGYRNLNQQIAETERRAEALRARIEEVSQTNQRAGNSANNLGNIFQRFSGIGSMVSKMLGKLHLNVSKLSISMPKLQKSTEKATSAMKNFSRQVLSSMGIYLSIRSAIKGLKEAIVSSMNMIETIHYFNVSFEQIGKEAASTWKEAGYESAEAYAKSFAERSKELTSKMTGFNVSETGILTETRKASLGIDPNLLMNYQATFAQMSNSMGVASETALKLSNALTQIGADLSSTKNVAFKNVYNDMASGLAGMSRTLDKYGVNIRNANMQQKLNELGLKANITKLNQNNKALLRTIILLDRTRYAWGDMADRRKFNELPLVA